MPDRKNKPFFKTSEKIDIKEIKKLIFADNIPVYLLKTGDQEIIKLDFIFEAGKIYHKNPLIPEITNILIDKGTKNLSSEEISERFDFYGAYLETEIGKHYASVTLYSLNKYFQETFELLFEILFNAVFPENEIDIYLKNKYQSFLIDIQKTGTVSSQLFSETIFGKEHPYGKIIKDIDFKTISKKQIKDFYNTYYLKGNMFVMFSGKISDSQVSVLKYFLKNTELSQKKIFEPNFNTVLPEPQKVFKKIKNTVQSSLRVGKVMINKLHPDFFNLNIATIILGGYFGSRLMMNVREDKGYTYGISAVNISYLRSGFFVIAAESGNDVYLKALDEIYKELKQLRTIPVEFEELTRVKKFLYGNLIKIVDGPLALSEAYKSIISFNLSSEYFYNYLDSVKTITPEKLIEISQKYLHEDSMFEVVSGA